MACTGGGIAGQSGWIRVLQARVRGLSGWGWERGGVSFGCCDAICHPLCRGDGQAQHCGSWVRWAKREARWVGGGGGADRVGRAPRKFLGQRHISLTHRFRLRGLACGALVPQICGAELPGLGLLLGKRTARAPCPRATEVPWEQALHRIGVFRVGVGLRWQHTPCRTRGSRAKGLPRLSPSS